MKQVWVVFDLDGTLIESEQIWHAVRHEFVTTHGGHWNDGAPHAMIGMRTEEWSRYIHDELGVRLPAEQIAQRVVARVVERISRSVPVLPGADAVLRQLAAAFPLGLATSATRVVADTALAKTGWDQLFTVVVSADAVAHGKPSPDVYLRAFALLGADPARTVAVEDSSNGIRSAHAAGVAVLAVPNRAYPPDPDALALAARVLGELREIDPALVHDVLRA